MAILAFSPTKNQNQFEEEITISSSIKCIYLIVSVAYFISLSAHEMNELGLTLSLSGENIVKLTKDSVSYNQKSTQLKLYFRNHVGDNLQKN